MGKDTKIVIAIAGDTKSFEKSLDQAARKLERTRKSTKKTDKEVDQLGKSFTQTANSVAIFNGQLDPISGRLSAIGTGITRFGVGSIVAAAGVTTMVLAFKKAITAADQYDKRQLRFNALLKATSHSARLTATDLEALADSIGKDTLSNTEEAATGINALLTFRKVQGETFKETIRLARDAQVAFGGNLREGVVAFGKALNDPIANLGALSRKGIQFSDTQKEMIEQFWEMGDAAAAQNIIIQEMRNQFGGLAEQEAKTLEGKLDTISHNWSKMWEAIGKTDRVQRAMEGLSYLLDDVAGAMEGMSATHTKINERQERFNDLVAEATRLSDRYSMSLVGREKLQRKLTEAREEYNKSDKTDEDKAKLNRLERQANVQLGFLNKRKKALETANKALANYGAEETALNKQQTTNNDKANRLMLAQEKAANLTRYDEAVKAGDKLLLANKSRYESSHEKLNRFRDESIKNLSDQHNREEKAAIKAGKDLTAIHIKYSDAIQLVEQGHQDKMDKLNKREESRAKADENRKRRAIEVAASASRKRAKLLSGIEGGESKSAKITEKYKTQLSLLQRTVFTEIEIINAGFKTKEELQNAYSLKLKENYDNDLEAFNEAETSKTLKAQEESAKRAAEQFKKAVGVGFTDVENGADFTKDFFGVNVDEQANKYEMLETLTAEHLANINALGLDAGETQMRQAAIVAEFGIKQAELEREGRQSAVKNTWDVLGTLGASGSKKLFAMNKAANIGQAIMSTYTAAANAFRDVPYPFNIAASGLIAAAGFVQVRNIKNQQMPQFHDGISTVERGGSYLLQGGERVMTEKLNADLKEDLKRRKQGGGNGDTSISLTIPDTGNYNATEQWYENNREFIVNDIKYALSRP